MGRTSLRTWTLFGASVLAVPSEAVLGDGSSTPTFARTFDAAAYANTADALAASVVVTQIRPRPASAASPNVTIDCTVLRYESAGGPALVRCEGREFLLRGADGQAFGEPTTETMWSEPWFFDVGKAVVCTLCAAMAAGLTLGLTSIDEFALKVLQNRLAEEIEPVADLMEHRRAQAKLLQDQECAERVLPLISGHFFERSGCVPRCLNPSNRECLLVTLLMLNSAANEALPIFLDSLVPSWLAILLSMTVVLIFGEIIPSAIFTGPSQLSLAAALAPAVRVARLLVLPITWPISLLLDKCVGHAPDEHTRAELKALIRTLRSECLELDETSIMQGVLEMGGKTAADLARPMAGAFALAHDSVVDGDTATQLSNCSHSRAFVYRRDEDSPSRRDDIVGVLPVQRLLGLQLGDCRRLDSLSLVLEKPVVLGLGDSVLSALSKFRHADCSLALVSAKPQALARALWLGERIPVDARPIKFASFHDIMKEILDKESNGSMAETELWRSDGSSFIRCSSTKSSMRGFTGSTRAGSRLQPSLARRFSDSSSGELSDSNSDTSASSAALARADGRP